MLGPWPVPALFLGILIRKYSFSVLADFEKIGETLEDVSVAFKSQPKRFPPKSTGNKPFFRLFGNFNITDGNHGWRCAVCACELMCECVSVHVSVCV